MKLSTLLLFMLAIEFSIVIFSEGTYVDNTPLMQAVINPHLWSDTIMFAAVGLIIAGAVIAGSYVGSFIYGKADIMIYAGLVALIILWLVPIVSLWDMIYTELGGVIGDAEVPIAGLEGGLSTSGAAIIASIFTAPLVVLAFTTTINWWRGIGEG